MNTRVRTRLAMLAWLMLSQVALVQTGLLTALLSPRCEANCSDDDAEGRCPPSCGDCGCCAHPLRAVPPRATHTLVDAAPLLCSPSEPAAPRIGICSRIFRPPRV